MARAEDHGTRMRWGWAPLPADDCIEAVIGLGPNPFYGTGAPAGVPVPRRPHRKRGEREKEVLFINADRDFTVGRNQNEPGPEQVEKIIAVFHQWRQLLRCSRAVSVADLPAAEANLDIRRWVDNSPPAETQDVRAHLYGGVPVAEVAGKKALFTAYGVNAATLFAKRDGDSKSYDFVVRRGVLARRTTAKGYRSRPVRSAAPRT